jgi:hypothetical protein
VLREILRGEMNEFAYGFDLDFGRRAAVANRRDRPGGFAQPNSQLTSVAPP